MHNQVDNIEVLVKCGFRGEETNVGYPVYTQIFRYTKRNNEAEYGFLIRHREIVSSDYLHDDIVLTCGDTFEVATHELINTLHEYYGIDKGVSSRHIQEAST